MNRARAFTLMELMVTIALLGLAFGMVFFKLDGLLPGRRLVSDARTLGSMLEQARNVAVVSGFRVSFEYDLDENQWRMYYPFEISNDAKTVAGEGETVLYDWTDLSETIRFHDVVIGDSDPIDSGQVVVTFEPRGIATGHTVHLTKEDSEVFYTVMISPLLGYVDIEPDYVAAEVLPDER